MLCVVCVVGFERSGVGEEGENGAGIGDRRHPFFCACHITGSPSSKYEHRWTSALLCNVRNVRICMGKKTYRFCNLRKWKDFNKKQFTLLEMCVTSLLCGPRADLWPFYGFLCKRFSLYIRFTPGVYLHFPHSLHRRDVTHILSKVSCFLLKSFHFRRLQKR